MSNSSSTSKHFEVGFHSPLHTVTAPAQKVKANVVPVRPSLLEHRMELLTAQVGQLVTCGLE
ncbi:hypothetical protein [Deinococcus cavernae]|uniref:hypothetical protein n=1 Tax=Deinococcus cavernae TaxID=2320857 RepID=UPI0011C216EC|nr:hypothetical protein [Deinococcus cavernae]